MKESSQKEAEKVDSLRLSFRGGRGVQAMVEKENYEAEIGATKRDMLQRVREFEGKMSTIREEVVVSTLLRSRQW